MSAAVAAFSYTALPGRVVFGAGCSRRELAAELQQLGAQRVLLVVAGPESALARDLTGPLGGRVVATFGDVHPHVPAATVDQVVAAARDARADAVLCIGGGSTLHTGLPIVAVPTTYAGSEMTPIWGVTADGRKTTGRDPVVQPKTVLYDPDLTLSLPATITVSSAVNALAHCLEALYARGANPVTSLLAVEGVRAVADGLPRVTADLHNRTGRELLLYGAYLAGSAFAAAGSGLHHTICHVLGGAYDLPHAETHTVVLPHVLAFNEAAVPDMRRIATALGTPTATAGLTSLLAAVDAPTALRDLGLPADALEPTVRLIVDKDLSGNPRAVGEDDVRRILTAAWHGARASTADPADGPHDSELTATTTAR